MNNNEDNSGPPLGGNFSSSYFGNLLDRLRDMGGLTVAAIALIPIGVFIAYAVFSNSRETGMLKASAKMEAAVAAYEAGDMDGSLEILKDIRERFSGFETAALAEYYEGAILFTKGEDEKSIERFKGFLSLSPDALLKWESLFMAGFSSFRLERWGNAIQYFERLLAESPSHGGRVLPLLGTAYRNNGDPEKAEQIFSQFVRTLPAGSN